MFEAHTDPLLSQRRFLARMVRFLVIGTAVDAFITVAGATGFRLLWRLGWLDAFVDAAMVVTGNGPRHTAPGEGGKLFLAFYALIGGTVYIVVVALVLAPAVHRLFHVFHLRAPDDP
jgi:hypothetical protein